MNLVDIQADETPAVEVVLNADKKRLELLSEVRTQLQAMKILTRESSYHLSHCDTSSYLQRGIGYLVQDDILPAYEYFNSIV